MGFIMGATTSRNQRVSKVGDEKLFEPKTSN